MKIFIFLLCILLCTSCLRKIEGQNKLLLPPDEVQALQERCILSNEENNVFSLNKELKENVQSLNSTWSRNAIEENKDEIEKISLNVTKIIKKLKEITSSEFSEKKYPFQISWDIKKDIIQEDLERISMQNKMTPAYWRLIDKKISKIYSDGRELIFDNSDARNIQDGISTSFSKNTAKGIQVVREGLASALDVCQLQKVLLIVVELVYREINPNSIIEKKFPDVLKDIKLNYGLIVKNP
jgi:uncharacterized protein YukE